MSRLKSTGEAVGEAASAFDAFKVVVASIVLIGVGAFLFVGPGEVAEHVPAHPLVGGAVMAFGVVFFVGFRGGGDAPGPIAVRCRALNYALMFVFVSGLLLYATGGRTLEAFELSRRGVEAQAMVGGEDRSKFDQDGNLLVLHRLHFAGFSPLVDLGGDFTSGQTVRVLHLPDDGATYRINPSGTGFLDLVKDQGPVALGMGALALVFCLFGVLFNLRTILFGEPKETT